MTKEQKELTDKFTDEFRLLLHRDTIECNIDIKIAQEGIRVNYNHDSYRVK